MTNERLESSHFPYLPLRVQIGGRSYDLDALVDTGFDGDVTVPASLFGIELPERSEVHGHLADGSVVLIPSYAAEVRLGRQGPFPIFLLVLGDEPSVGRGITDRFRLILDHGERVVLEP